MFGKKVFILFLPNVDDYCQKPGKKMTPEQAITTSQQRSFNGYHIILIH